MQNISPEDQKEQTFFTAGVNAASQPSLDTVMNPAQPGKKQSLFYTQDQEDDRDLNSPLDEQEDQFGGQSSPFVLPFQNSGTMQTIAQMGAAGTKRMTGATPGVPPSPPQAGKTWQTSSQVLKYLLIACVVLVTLLGASLFVFAQSAAPGTTQGQATHNATTNGAGGITQPVHTTPQAKPPTATPMLSKPANQPQNNQTQGQGTQGTNALSSNEVPSTQQLSQFGWTQAGLSSGDAIEALRTGATFTDREMSYDYRDIGTITNHSGTLTASTFLLTTGGRNRFLQNDVRVINNLLYNKIRTGKIIQQVVNAQPSLIQFQTMQIQGQQHQFAWITVSFELLRSKIDPTSGTRTEGLELDAVSGQPLIHHMTTVLVRVSLQNQGANAPMGGTGWLVNIYALDANTLPTIATSPSL